MTILAEPEMKKVPRKSAKTAQHHPAPTMQQVGAIILGGGQGTRLHPLTLTRSKPAICFGGYYRIIDVALSNAINSGCQKISVITQFFSTSLHQHIYRTYQAEAFTNGALQLLPVEERPSHRGWFAGTADAVRQNLKYILESPADYFLILSGDQLYHIDFKKMLDFAYAANADLTIASIPVEKELTHRLGILQIDNDCRITGFLEKPESIEGLNSFELPINQRKGKATSGSYLASMGIYLFKRQALIDLLMSDSREDFGKHLIPTKVAAKEAFAFLYDGYWEDIGTIESFHKANIALTDSSPAFDCYNEQWPLHCRHHNLAGSKISKTVLDHVVVCEGSLIDANEISYSILGPRSIVKEGCVIRETYLMGNDFYHPAKHSHYSTNLSIGQNTVINKAIIDKHVSIGKNVELVNKQNLFHYDSPELYVRDGIIVVPEGTIIPDGFSF